MSYPDTQNPGRQPSPVAFVGVSEAARICSVHRKTILRWIAQGHLVAEALTPTSPYRVRRADLEAFLLKARLGRKGRHTQKDPGNPS